MSGGQAPGHGGKRLDHGTDPWTWPQTLRPGDRPLDMARKAVSPMAAPEPTWPGPVPGQWPLETCPGTGPGQCPQRSRTGTGADLKIGRDRGFVVELGVYDCFLWFSSASGGSVEAVSVAGVGCDVGAVGAVASGSASPFPFAGSAAVFGAVVSGGGVVCVVHGDAVVGGPLPGVGASQRGDVSAAVGGVGAQGAARGRACGVAASVG
jgi:hypothetical protein